MTHEWTELTAMVAVGVVAAFVNVLAGGGSLIAMPALIMIGLPDTVANGTVRVAVMAQTTFAVLRYHRAERTDFRLTRKLALPTLIGALVGAWLATQVSDKGFRVVLVTAILGAAAALLAQPWIPALQPSSDPSKATPKWLVVLLMIGVGLYGGFLQAGVGFVLLAVLAMGAGLPLVDANIQKVSIVLCYTPIALALFLWQGKVDVEAGAALAVGQAVGAWFGAGMALEKGATFIRTMVAIVLLLSVIKLLI